MNKSIHHISEQEAKASKQPHAKYDPWHGDQKQIRFPVPAWLTLVVLAPFRLIAGFFRTASAIDKATNFQDTSERRRSSFADKEYFNDKDLYGDSVAETNLMAGKSKQQK